MAAPMDAAFLTYLGQWQRELRPFVLAKEIAAPERAAVLSADMVVGFCSRGSLASPRIGGLVPAVKALFQRAYDRGIRQFVLLQDTHSEDAPEFQAFPPHCLRGTDESQTVPELRALPFADRFAVMEKNSLHPALGTGLDRWLEEHGDLRDFLVVGDCTDLCTYSLAMHLRLWANALGLQGRRVIVPANAVDTYDTSVATAREVGALPHPGDFFHLVFLYHMALNGIQVVREVV